MHAFAISATASARPRGFLLNQVTYCVVKAKQHDLIRRSARFQGHSFTARRPIKQFYPTPTRALSSGQASVHPDVEKQSNGTSGVATFEQLGIDPHFLPALSVRGIRTPVEVQLQAIPEIMQGKDVIVQSHTGTGKTLAYLLPLLTRLLKESDPKARGSQQVEMIIVAPTRELAMQIHTETEILTAMLQEEGAGGEEDNSNSKGSGPSVSAKWVVQQLIGGANPSRQIERLKKRKPRIIVGTPGRIAEFIRDAKLKTNDLKVLVLDEVDHLIQKSFRDDTELIAQRANKLRRQTVFASATIPPVVNEMTAQFMRDQVHVHAGRESQLPPNVQHVFHICHRRKGEALKRLIVACAPRAALVFVNDNWRINELGQFLSSGETIPTAALHGDSDKDDRGRVLQDFRRGDVQVLVCTEMAARGLDLPNVSHVFNLDLPTDALHYIHRAGRTGRLNQVPVQSIQPRDEQEGQQARMVVGTVVSLVNPDEAFVIDKLESKLRISFERVEVYGGKLYTVP